MRISELTPTSGKAIVEINGSGRDTEELASGLLIYHGSSNKEYQPNLDWEIGTVLALGSGDWEPLEVGDQVIVQAESGGIAGADISAQVGEKRGVYVVVESEEIVCKVS